MADAKTKKGGKGWIGGLLLSTLVAVGTGGMLGVYLLSTVEKAVDRKVRDEQSKVVPVMNYAGDLSLRSVGSVVTNLAEPAESWVRIESSVVLKGSSRTPTSRWPKSAPISSPICAPSPWRRSKARAAFSTCERT